MPYWNDLQHPHTKQKRDIVIGEIFNTSHDVLNWVKKEERKIEKNHTWFKKIKGAAHFMSMTSIIFVILLFISNWSAYTTFARALLKPETLNAEKVQIEGGLASTTITESTDTTNKKQLRKQRILRKNLEKNQSITPDLSANYFNQDVTHVSLSVNIAPYEDRIIIPKIGKNIPLVDVESHNADSSNEWNEIFMKELENGIVKYPGSADPGQKGNSFIFGHSSNYPWAKWNYNDVFALLNELVTWDEIIVYFHQKKFIYTVKEKKIVKPGHISSLGGYNDDRRLTLMTCWPLGTTLNRLLVVTELKEITHTI